VVELEVAGVDDRAERRLDRVPDPVGDRVAHPEGGDAEDAHGELAPRLHDVEGRRVEQLVLAQLALDQSLGQLRRVDRGARDTWQDVGQAAGVVLVPVREDDRPHPVPVLLEVGRVRDHKVDPEHLGIREGQATVDHKDLAGGIDGRDVLADLAHPAQRDDAQRIGHSVSLEEGHL
jgi:hypothetical protein